MNVTKWSYSCQLVYRTDSKCILKQQQDGYTIKPDRKSQQKEQICEDSIAVNNFMIF